MRTRTSGGLRCLPVAIAGVALGLAGGAFHEAQAGSRADRDCAFVLTTNYWDAAEYVTIDIDPPRTVWVSPDPPGTDAVAYYAYPEDMVFIVNRYLADNVQVVDPNDGFDTIAQHSVGNGSNPHDIRLTAHDRAYISRFEWKTLLVMNPFTGAFLDSIDLSPLADADGIPEMDRMALVDDRLFVTLNNIDHATWLPAGPGKVAVIDVAADTLVDVDPATPGVQPITLHYPNPYTELRYDLRRQQLIVGCLGCWSVLDGGVEAIDPFTFETEVVISEVDLGGDVSDALLSPTGEGYAVVMDPDPWPDNFARLVEFDPLSQAVTDTLFKQTGGSGSSLAGMELNTQGEIYLCDRNATQPGVRIYDTGADTLVEFIDVGLPPFDVAFVQPPPMQPSAPGEGRAASRGLAVGRNYPNPFNPETTIPFALGREGAVRVDVVDVEGRRVVTLLDAWLPAGEHRVRWSGVDRAGTAVRAGVFFCRVRSGPEAVVQKLVVVR